MNTPDLVTYYRMDTSNPTSLTMEIESTYIIVVSIGSDRLRIPYYALSGNPFKYRKEVDRMFKHYASIYD